MHGINLNYGLHYTTHLRITIFLMQVFHLQPVKIIRQIISSSLTSTLFTIQGILFHIFPMIQQKHLFLEPLGLGFTFGKINKFTAGFDFIMTKWSDAKIPGNSRLCSRFKVISFWD